MCEFVRRGVPLMGNIGGIRAYPVQLALPFAQQTAAGQAGAGATRPAQQHPRFVPRTAQQGEGESRGQTQNWEEAQN
jgi:hypothetical protein